MDHLVSIVIPTFNGSKTVRSTLESILRQEFTDYEVIVVDDGSTDSTVEMVRELLPSARVIQQSNQGTMAARQTGIEAAHGTLIALLDQDDLWVPQTLRKEVDVLLRRPEIGLVTANMQCVDEDGKPLGFDVIPNPESYTLSWEKLLFIQPIATSTTLFRKDLAPKIGGLDPDFGFSGALGDLDMYIKISEVTESYFLNERLGYYRWSETRPGRLVSFLDNLEVYSRKYWKHPRVQLAENVQIRSGLVQACCNYALHIYGLLLKQHGGKVPTGLLEKLNEHTRSMAALFAGAYETHIGLKPLDLGTMDCTSEAIRALLFLYLLRLDLQLAFPQVRSGNLDMLVLWGAEVAAGKIADGDSDLLKQFAPELKEAVATGVYQSAGRAGGSGAQSSVSKRSHLKSWVRLLISRLRGRIYITLSSSANRAFPVYSRRRRLFRPVLRGVKILLTLGWARFAVSAREYIKSKAQFAASWFTKPAAASSPAQQDADSTDLRKAKLAILRSDMGTGLSFPTFDLPVVAIVVNAAEDLLQSYQCLESLAAHSTLPYHLFIARGQPSSEGDDFSHKLQNVVLLPNTGGLEGRFQPYDALSEHLGSEKYVLFVQGHMVVTGAYLEHTLRVIEADPHCGAVTGRMVDPAGRLVEAGGVVWDDGSFSGYGAGDAPDKPEYSFVRPVLSTSSDCILIRRELLPRLREVPAGASAPTSLWKPIIESGYSVVYQPAAIAITQSTTHGTAEVGRRRSAPNDSRTVLAGRTAAKTSRILVLDDYIPAMHYGSGFPRLYEMLRCLAELGYQTTFLPVGNPTKVQPETWELQQQGIEVFWGAYANLEQFVRERSGFYDLVVISRPHVFERIGATVREHFPGAAIVYDAEALFYTREILKSQITGLDLDRQEQTNMMRGEMKLIEAADSVIAVSQKTREIMQQHSSQKNIEVWEHLQELHESDEHFRERNGILFFGSFFAGPGSPNEDAALYFAKEVFPTIHKELDCLLYIVGAEPTPAVRDLAGGGIQVIGYVDDLSRSTDACRVNVVPTRFAAGIPLKLLEAMSHGIPSVVSSLIAGQLGLTDGQQVLVAQDAKAFAAKVIELYSDEPLWRRIRQNSMEYVRDNYSRIRMRERLNSIIAGGLEITERKRHAPSGSGNGGFGK